MRAWPFSLLVGASIFTFEEQQKTNILITGHFDRNSANIAKLCARAFEQGPISFRRVLEKFGGSNSQKYMSCSCREVEIFIAIHIYLKPDSPFSFRDLSVYIPVQLRASPPLPPLNYFSLPPPPSPPRAHIHLKESAQETHTLCVFDQLPVVSWRRAILVC